MTRPWRDRALPLSDTCFNWSGRQDLNLRPLGSGPSTLTRLSYTQEKLVFIGRPGRLRSGPSPLSAMHSTDGAPANVAQRERFERSSPWTKTRRSTHWSYRCLFRLQHLGGCQDRLHPTDTPTKQQSRFTCPHSARQSRITKQQARNPSRCCHTSWQPPKCRKHGAGGTASNLQPPAYKAGALTH